MKKILVALAATTVLGNSLASCGAEVKEAKLVNYFLCGQKSAAAAGEAYEECYLKLFDDLTYSLTITSYTLGYGMNLGNSVIETFGTYEQKTEKDGYTPIDLKISDRVILNSFSEMGGFNIFFDTNDENLQYPVEMPAKAQGQKNFAESKDDIINEYGKAKTIYADDEKKTFSFTNPTEE